MTAKWMRCPERDKDGHRCTRKIGHADVKEQAEHKAFGKVWR